MTGGHNELKGIPSMINPDLLKILMEMGHGDEICIGDGNFPTQAATIVWISTTKQEKPPAAAPREVFYGSGWQEGSEVNGFLVCSSHGNRLACHCWA
jgi:hypothetical protein